MTWLSFANSEFTFAKICNLTELEKLWPEDEVDGNLFDLAAGSSTTEPNSSLTSCIPAAKFKPASI
jgi:hypothetical protein